jgi:methyl coenzyme M reductase subunit D
VIKARLDASQVTRAYSSALRQLARLSGFDQRAVLLGEAGIILKTWAGRTKVATQAQADRRSWRHIIGRRGLDLGTAREPGDVSVNVGDRGPFGRVWVRTKKGKYRLAGQIEEKSLAFRPMNFHWSRGTWVDIREAVADVTHQGKKKLARGRRAAGLARQSVVQIADALGIDLLAVKGGGTLSSSGIAKARAALATTGRPYKNGTGSVLGAKEKTVITLINRLPYGIPQKMDRTLLGILSGRAKFFERNYAERVFDSMSNTARAYPWLRIRRPAGLN